MNNAYAYPWFHDSIPSLFKIFLWAHRHTKIVDSQPKITAKTLRLNSNTKVIDSQPEVTDQASRSNSNAQKSVLQISFIFFSAKTYEIVKKPPNIITDLEEAWNFLWKFNERITFA